MQIRISHYIQYFILACLLLMVFATEISAQVEGTDKRYIKVGKLQSHVSAYGSERAWNNIYYEGLVWPADYSEQDNAVIKRAWIGVLDFTDAESKHYDVYSIYFARDEYVGITLFPVELKQTARFSMPAAYVDGDNVNALYAGDIDELDENQIADRIVTNVVNTSIGLTQTRRIYAFSQQHHDDYLIKEFIYTNTGNVDYDEDIELNATLKGVRFGWGIRYSVCREGAKNIGGPQSYGRYTWVTKRGEDYPHHIGESITEANPIVEWIRCGFCWAGQAETNAFDNIGGPDVLGNGRLTAPQHAGITVLHVDKSASDHSDDPNQPTALGWHAGDTYPQLGDLSPSFEKNMAQVYDMLSGIPYKGKGGVNRFDETYMSSNPDPSSVHNDLGGTNLWITYGPFDLEPGESIRIVEAEAVNGLNRLMCERIGARWKKAYDNPSDTGPFDLPDGNTTTDKDEYKNAWFYTGKDSILEVFGRAKRNFDLEYLIPQPPLPPPVFQVTSGGDRITLEWAASPSEFDPVFSGYKIYRAIGKSDTTYENIYNCGAGVTLFEDKTAIRGKSYYYYIVSVNDGSNNSTGSANPAGPLHSSRFYTRTTKPAYLTRKPTSDADSIRVVPNPYNIRARDSQYPGEPDKIMFLNLPGQCKIHIYTERGDLIETLDHIDGSGDEAWNSITSSRQVVVSGIYIAVIKPPNGKPAIRKFVIIR